MKKIFKAIYGLIPFKPWFFFLIKKCMVLPQRIYRHLHFRGVFRVKAAPGLQFKLRHYGFEIENEIFWKGLDQGWEKVSIGIWKQLCPQAKVIFDIGANTGIYSLIAQTMNPDASIYAFEPVDRVYEKLVENCRLNGFPVTCVEKAASNYTGKARIYDTTDAHALSVTVNKNLHDPDRPVIEKEISTITLQQFIEDAGINRVDLIKMDVETHEAEVLEGFGEYLNRFRPSMLIEILNDEVGKKIGDLVAGLDYLYFNIDENKGIRQVDSISHSDYYNYLLCSKTTAQQLKLISS